MRDRRGLNMFTEIAALRAAQRAAAYQDLADARASEREAEDAASRADARTAAAAQAWDTHIASSAFAPELARALAEELVGRGNAARAANECFARMTEARGEAEQAWQSSDARCRLAERALADQRREVRRDRDERALAAQADRTATRWRRK